MLWDGLLLPLVLLLADEVGDADAAGQRVQEGEQRKEQRLMTLLLPSLVGQSSPRPMNQPILLACCLLVAREKRGMG